MYLNSVKQCPTPLNSLFFSEFNMHILQRAIRQEFKNQSGIAIDYQNQNDLFAIMRVVYVNNAGKQNDNVNEQVKFMNEQVIKTAMSQIHTGVSQYMGYAHDIDTLIVPLAQPINTSTYGKKIDLSRSIDQVGV